MNGEKYPAKLIEKVARAIYAKATEGDYTSAYQDIYANDGQSKVTLLDGLFDMPTLAEAALDATSYAAMREALEGSAVALEEAVKILRKDFPTLADEVLAPYITRNRAALRAADGEET